MRIVRHTVALCLLLTAGIATAQKATAQAKPRVSASAPRMNAPASPRPAAAEASEYRLVDWNLLSGYDVDPFTSVAAANRRIPKRVRDLEGTKVILSGYTIPFDFKDGGITKFALSESLDACGYGENLRPTNWVSTEMKPGKKAPYSQFQTIEVFGTIQVGAVWEGDRLSSLYYLAADSARYTSDGR